MTFLTDISWVQCHFVRYVVLFGYGWCDEICDRIKYLISKKGGITGSINHNLARIRIESYNSLPIEKD